MIALLRLLFALLVMPFRSKSVLEAENAALRQQILVLRRKLRGRVKLSNGDRLFFVWLYRLFPSIPRAMLIIRPERWSGGTAPAFATTGVGSHVGTSAGPGSTAIFAP